MAEALAELQSADFHELVPVPPYTDEDLCHSDSVTILFATSGGNGPGMTAEKVRPSFLNAAIWKEG